MRHILALLFSFFILINSASGQSSAAGQALTAAAVTGSVVAISHLHYQKWLESELEDWKDEDTDTTISLNKGCGLLLETRVFGNRRMNSIMFAVSNNTKESVMLRPSKVTIVFSDGKRRFPKYPFEVKPIEVKPNWWGRGLVNLPSKINFKDIESLKVKVPIYDIDGKQWECELSGELKRNPNRPQLKSSYQRGTYFDMSLLLGPNLLKTESSDDVFGDLSMFFSWGLYFWNNHGLNLGFSSSGLSDQTQARVESQFTGEDATTTGWHVGYIGKTELVERHNLFWQIGLMRQSIGVRNTQKSSDEVYKETSYYATLGYEWVFSRVDWGYWTGDYSVGVHIMHNRIGTGDVLGQPVDGSVNALLGAFRIAL